MNGMVRDGFGAAQETCVLETPQSERFGTLSLYIYIYLYLSFGLKLVGVWIGGLWQGHFAESTNTFQRPKFAGKSFKLRRNLVA